ncbi:MAG TPA: ribonuclease E inhibitor RraB [Bryobacteraceae bacterium]|jgi:hypothetical protein|nr:ribonuclease E inhibitor RraB [Acidobacteriaceae bacterium]
MSYPNDDNGEALRRMKADGDDLSQSRDIDFTVVLPNDFAANRFAEYFRDAGYTTNVRLSQVRESHPWEVVVTNHMVPTYEGIVAFESELNDSASTLGGHNDGWGCFAQLPRHLQ